jgi:arsenite-transporting ATPase
MTENKRDLRIILYTGKGGVGKTTVAGATALRCSQLGYRTLVISTDPAHSLADSFDRKLGPEPTKIRENLYGQEIDVYYSIEKHWGTLKEYLRALFKWQGVDEVLAEELAILPGMEEGAAFLWVHQFAKDKEFDVIVIDSAPTGETLRLLSLPDVGRWWMEKIFPIQKRMVKVLGPAIRAITDAPIPSEKTYDAAEDLYTRLEEIHRILSNEEVSSIRIVVNPEKMVIREAQRAYTYLNLYGYPVDLIIVNRVLPKEATSEYFRAQRSRQNRYLKLIEESFSPLPIVQIPQLGKEVFGLKSLEEIANHLFSKKDPTKIYYTGNPMRIVSEDGAYQFYIRLPFAKKSEIKITQWGDELILQVGIHRRNIFLPRFLAGMHAKEAKLEGDELRITFVQEAQQT